MPSFFFLPCTRCCCPTETFLVDCVFPYPSNVRTCVYMYVSLWLNVDLDAHHLLSEVPLTVFLFVSAGPEFGLRSSARLQSPNSSNFGVGRAQGRNHRAHGFSASIERKAAVTELKEFQHRSSARPQSSSSWIFGIGRAQGRSHRAHGFSASVKRMAAVTEVKDIKLRSSAGPQSPNS